MNGVETLISVIIPCFNHGAFVAQAIESVRSELSRNFEIIVVDDGSTDNTRHIIAQSPDVRYIYQVNMGLAAARNKGILHAKGKYILPLDSDNFIVPEVFIEAAGIMEKNDAIDVVYTDAKYFGDLDKNWIVGSFDGIKLLANNFIDACALIRKKTLLEVGLYDSAMPAMGNEDWELWIRFFLRNKNFCYLSKVGFHYRVAPKSMTVNITRPGFEENRKYIFNKHTNLIAEKINELNSLNKSLTERVSDVNTLNITKRLKLIGKLILSKKIV